MCAFCAALAQRDARRSCFVGTHLLTPGRPRRARHHRLRRALQVDLDGAEVLYTREDLSARTSAELQWSWRALSAATCCRSVAVFHAGRCVLQAGLAPVGGARGGGKLGPLSEEVMKRGKANYLANLALYPGARAPRRPSSGRHTGGGAAR